MATEIRDLNGVTLVVFQRLPRFPLGRSQVTNVASALSVGGKARSSRRGPTRTGLRLVWDLMPASQAGDFLKFLRDYAGGAKAFILHIDPPLTTLCDGSRVCDGSWMVGGDLRCRYYAAAPSMDEAFLTHHRFECELTEDLA